MKNPALAKKKTTEEQSMNEYEWMNISIRIRCPTRAYKLQSLHFTANVVGNLFTKLK